MVLKRIALPTIILLFFLVSCKDNDGHKSTNKTADPVQVDTVSEKVGVAMEEKDSVELTEENAIDFFFNYNKKLKANTLKITTNLGSFTVRLYDDVPYHKANFIYLTRKGYFNNTQFHRVVKNFIIQGGNSDDQETSAKRRKIGRYLLPPDTRKGHKHHRGTLSMPSSEIDNPHMLASPFEFFIVVTKPGAYHLDGDYTPFGEVVEGMDVVDKINSVRVGKGDWPFQNVFIKKVEVLN